MTLTFIFRQGLPRKCLYKSIKNHRDVAPTKYSSFQVLIIGFPGGRNVPTPRRSILHPTKSSQLPYKAKIQFFGVFGLFWPIPY